MIWPCRCVQAAFSGSVPAPGRTWPTQYNKEGVPGSPTRKYPVNKFTIHGPDLATFDCPETLCYITHFHDTGRLWRRARICTRRLGSTCRPRIYPSNPARCQGSTWGIMRGKWGRGEYGEQRVCMYCDSSSSLMISPVSTPLAFNCESVRNTIPAPPTPLPNNC